MEREGLGGIDVWAAGCAGGGRSHLDQDLIAPLWEERERRWGHPKGLSQDGSWNEAKCREIDAFGAFVGEGRDHAECVGTGIADVVEVARGDKGHTARLNLKRRVNAVREHADRPVPGPA